MEEETIAIPKIQFDAINKDWLSFQDYVKRQNELNAMLEKQTKQRKTAIGFIELFLLVGTIALSVFSILAFLVLVYFCVIGVKVDSLALILGAAAFLLFGFNIFQFIRVFQSGDWFKFGLELRKHKNGWIKFTKGRAIMMQAAPYSQKAEFRSGNDSTIFLTRGKGYHDTSTGGTLFTVREGAISDFDVDEEYRGKIEDIGNDVKTIAKESWFAGAIWNKIDLPMLKQLLIICCIISGIAALMGMGAVVTSYQASDTLTKQIGALDGNMSIKINAIQQSIQQMNTAKGVIVSG